MSLLTADQHDVQQHNRTLIGVSLNFSALLPSTLTACLPFVNLALLSTMLSHQLFLTIPLCAAVYLLAVYLLLMVAQRDRLSRPRE